MDRSSILTRLECRGYAAPRVQLRTPAGEPRPREPLEGPSSGRYDVGDEIGRGGVGSVREGLDHDLGRTVAVKVLRARHAGSPGIVHRFLEEAQVGGQLQHPGIVPVYDVGLRPDRRPYFTMKLVRGRTLAEMLDARTEPADDRHQILSVFGQVCQTVAYAHTRGVVHRDLKPANVMVGSFGEVHVLDWGFAKLIDLPSDADEGAAPVATTVGSPGRAGASRAGAVMGTPSYMPPEQARGRIDDIDERADVFALGAILCEILTGGPPFPAARGDPLQQASEARLEDAEARLAAVEGDVDLVGVCRACLSPRLADRPRDASAVAHAVSTHLAAVEERAHRSRLAAVEERAAADRARLRAEEARAAALDQRRRRRQTLVLATAVIAALLAGGGAWLWSEGEHAARRERTTLVVTQALAEATSFAGERDWTRATASAARAHALAEQGEATPELRRRVTASGEAIRASRVAEERAEARAAEEDTLRNRLEDLRLRCAEADASEVSRLDAAFAAAFGAVGIDVGTLAPAALAQTLRERSSPAELAGALDEWAALRLRLPSLDVRGGRDLLRAACAVDEDTPPALVQAVVAEDVDDGLALAGRAEIAAWRPRDLDRLALVLAARGEADAAADLLLRVRWRHSADLWIQCHLADWLMACDPPRAEDALPHYSTALALRPSQAALYSRLGEARRMAGDYEGALVTHRRAVALASARARHHGRLGAEWQAMGFLEDAVAAYRTAVALDAECATAHRLLGVGLQEKGDLAGASVALERAQELDPIDPLTLFHLGTLRLESGRPGDAVTSLGRAAELDPEDARTHANLGAALHRVGDGEGAVAALRQAVVLDPDLAQAHYNLAVAYQARGEHEESVASLRQAFERRDLWDRRHVHSYTDVVLVDEGTMDAACAIAREAVGREPRDVAALQDLGTALTHRGALEAAAEVLQAAVGEDPTSARPLVLLGRVYGLRAAWAKAAAAFRRAGKLDPDDAAAPAGIGYVLARTGRFRQAVGPLRRALELDPDRAAIHTYLGIALAEQGQVAPGIEHLERSVALEPRRPNTQNILGAIINNKGADPERAARATHQAVRIAPWNPHCHENLGISLFYRGDTQRALECHRRALELDPRSLPAHNGLGTIACDRLQDYEGAARHFRDALEIAPQDPYIHFNLANALLELGDYEAAEESYRRAIELRPGYPPAHMKLGRMLLIHMRDPARAEQAFRAAARLQPRRPAPHNLLALALYRQDRTAEAIETLETVLRLKPDSADALALLAGVLCNCPQPELRNPERAIDLATRARRFGPRLDAVRVFGAALYRAGRHEEALDVLQGLAAPHPDGGGPRLKIWLAIVHAALGHREKARASYDAACDGLEGSRPDLRQIRRLLDEARSRMESTE